MHCEQFARNTIFFIFSTGTYQRLICKVLLVGSVGSRWDLFRWSHPEVAWRQHDSLYRRFRQGEQTDAEASKQPSGGENCRKKPTSTCPGLGVADSLWTTVSVSVKWNSNAARKQQEQRLPPRLTWRPPFCGTASESGCGLCTWLNVLKY